MSDTILMIGGFFGYLRSFVSSVMLLWEGFSLKITCETCYMNVLAGKYPRDWIFFWVGKSTQIHRSNFIMLCPAGEEGWILPRSDLGDSFVTSYLPEHSGFPEYSGVFSPEFWFP